MSREQGWPVTFRVASETSGPLRSIAEVEQQLNRRLRILCGILAVAMGALAITTVIDRRIEIAADSMTLWTRPPLPGVLFVLSAIGALFTWVLAPAHKLTMPLLRAVETLGTAMMAAFFVVNQTRALGEMHFAVSRWPMEVGVAQGAPWGILLVAYGVLVPGSLMRSAVRIALVGAAAFIPDLIVLPDVEATRAAIVGYVALKAFIIGVMAALALYGSYRIETLGEQAEVARELGQYLLRRCLGEGGMGSVYLAEHRMLRRPCAVKMIRPEQARDERAMARFEREVQCAATLTHPNTVQIFDYGRSDDGTFYFAMEFLAGVSLDRLVEEHGPMEPARAVHVLGQLCGALHEAHARGLVHRDVKPSNIMLCERGGVHDVAKLLDFGLVAAVSQDDAAERITQAGMVIGTPAYMSPEQSVGEATTAASDIYSLGAVAYFLLTGRSPFGGRSAVQIIAAHLNETPRPVHEMNPAVPRALADVVARCLAKEPQGRYPDVRSLQRALEASVREPWTSDAARVWWDAHAGRAAGAGDLAMIS